jgi:hypothetical protein
MQDPWRLAFRETSRAPRQVLDAGRFAAVNEVRECGSASVKKVGEVKEVARKENETNEMNEQAK